MPINRIQSLDALRGLAALWVLWAHCLGAIEGAIPLSSPWYRFTPLRLFSSGQFPVILFFVLSGFVLARQLLRQPGITYPQFAVRRICRIYIPYAVSVLVAWVLANVIGTPLVAGVSDNINSDWIGSTSIDALVRHLMMVGRREDTNLNGVAWSLVVEMRVSLIFPVLMACLLISRWTILVLGAISIASYSLLIILGQKAPFFFGATFFLSLIMTIYFLLPFLIGIVLARYVDNSDYRMGGWSTTMAVTAVVICILLLQKVNHQLLQDIGYGLAAGAIILVALKSAELSRLLEFSVFSWLGRISYSLYLFHVIVLNALFKGLHGSVELPLLAVAAFPLSLLTAEIANRLIEQPAAELGHASSRALARSNSVGSASMDRQA